jgi:class 3 adenylate cyclase
MLLLHELFSKYDHLCKRFGIYKVETIGDCYMACSGLLVDNPDHAQHVVQFAKAMLGAAASVRNPLGGSVHIRVGVHSGRVMSGIVGSIRSQYCLFGDTVNTASRMESTGVVDRIQVRQRSGSVRTSGGSLNPTTAACLEQGHCEAYSHLHRNTNTCCGGCCRCPRTHTDCWATCSRTFSCGRRSV